MRDPLKYNTCPNQPLPSLNWDGKDDTASIRHYLKEVDSLLNQMQEAKTAADEVVSWRTVAIDNLLLALFERSAEDLGKTPSDRGHYTIVAQGGYGRQQLCLHSDIDLLFLHDHLASTDLKKRIEKILYPLWDGGLDIGFAVRTGKECLTLMKQDLTILTSLMDARYLAGDKKHFKAFQKKLWQCFAKRRFRQDFIQRLDQEHEERLRKFGSSVYLLEPNTKDGKGGLRDYHHIIWICQAAFETNDLKSLVKSDWMTLEEYQSLGEAVQFLWQVRNELHRRSARKTDQILVDYQANLATWFGFEDSDRILAAEDFMRSYYRHAAECFRISTKVHRKYLLASRKVSRLMRVRSRRKRLDQHFEVSQHFLSLKTKDLFAKEPAYLMKVFRIIQERGLELGRSVKEAIRENLHLIDEVYIKDPAHTVVFRQMLADPATVLTPLMEMHEVGVLERFLPEFSNLMYRVQHDIYHLYTVDVHSMLAVGELGKLLRGEYESQFPTPSSVARSFKEYDLLAFAILYHDIGKGEGSGHVAKGAPLVRQAAERLGFAPDQVDLLEFLELSHLLMTHLAFRRDLDDPNMILQFAKSMGHEDTLNLLYVQTFCDVKGTNPDALTNWKESLLEYLFLKTRTVLVKGDFSTKRVRETAANLRKDVDLLVAQEFTKEELDHFFHIMPPRYFLTAEAVTIADHLSMWRDLKTEDFIFHHRLLEKEGLNEWTLFTLDVPALFSKICGVLAANNLSIHEAQLNTSNDGLDLYIFKILSAQGHAISDDTKWQKLEQDVKDVIQGRESLKNLLESRLGPTLLKPKTARRFPTKIHIDNDLSAFYTVIDVYAHDRVGLLYHITSALEAMGLYVNISKIATKVDQVTDTFYVRDIFGHKITSQERLQRIRSTMLGVIEGRSTDTTQAKAEAARRA